AANSTKSDGLAVLFAGKSGAPVRPPGHEIDDRYKDLRELAAPGGGAPIDQVLKLIDDLRQELAKMKNAGTAALATTDGPGRALNAEALRQPQPLRRWLSAMAEQSTALRSGGTRQQVAAAYNGVNGPRKLCVDAVIGKFPFTPGSSSETPL